MNHVLIATLSQDIVCADFAFCLSKMILFSAYRHQEDFIIAGVLNHKTCVVHKGRNEIVLKALKVPSVTHLLMIDSDMTFPHDTLQRLLDHDQSVIGVQSSTRTFPQKSTAIKEGSNWLLGCGVILIDLEVFKKVEFPWFNSTYDGDKCLGEDYFFCRKAIESGFSVECDLNLSEQIGHIGQKVYGIT